MNSILLVKTSSLGDVVHNLPLVSDIRAAFPGVRIDWVAEEAFAAIPALHPAVHRVLPVAIRRWRSVFWRRETHAEISRFYGELRRTAYDAVIDTQGLLKSALIVRAARGRRYGLDWRSAREPLRFFYDRTLSVPWEAHAVERNRSLGAQALGYPLSPRVDYGIRASRASASWQPPERYAVLLHGTSAERKQWPEASWIALGTHLSHAAVPCVLPWGNALERERSERLARKIAASVVPPSLALEAAAAVLAGAWAAIGVDTGLTHLAAALGVPTVGIYCATDPARTGVYGCARGTSLGSASHAPQASEVIAALGRVTA